MVTSSEVVDRSAAAPTAGHWRWLVCGTLFLATVLNYLDRQTLSICSPLIGEEFQFSDEQYGVLVSAFRWSYAALHVPAGYIVDRFSVRLFYAAAVVVWSLAGASAAWATGFRTFAASRAALGFGEAFNWPCALRVTANILTPADRSLGNGIFQSGTAVGALVAPLIVAPVAVKFGWRASFLLVGALGAVWVVLWLLITRGGGSPRSVESPPRTDDRPRQPLVAQLGLIMSQPGFWVLFVASAFINPCWYFLAEWLAKFLHDKRGLDVLAAGLATTPIFLSADIGNLAGGGIVKLLTSRGLSVRQGRAAAATLGALLVPSAIAVNFIEDPRLCVAVLLLSAFGISALMVSWLACIQEIGFASVGLTMGLLGGFGCVVGAIVNPLIGKYVDTMKQQHPLDPIQHYYLIFVLLGVLPLVTYACILLFGALQARQARQE